MTQRITSHHWTTWRPTHWSRTDGELYQRVRGGYVDEHTWRNGGRQVLDSEADNLELEPWDCSCSRGGSAIYCECRG